MKTDIYYKKNYGSIEDMIRRLEDAAKTMQLLFDHSCLVNFEKGNAQLSEISSRLRDLAISLTSSELKLSNNSKASSP